MVAINSLADLREHIISAGVAVLSFSAPWCGACRSLAPTLAALEANNPALVIGQVNVGENIGFAKVAGIPGLRSIPALVLYRHGTVVGTLTGDQTLDTLQKFVDSAYGR